MTKKAISGKKFEVMMARRNSSISNHNKYISTTKILSSWVKKSNYILLIRDIQNELLR